MIRAIGLLALLASSCAKAPAEPVALYIGTVASRATAPFSPDASARLRARVKAGAPVQQRKPDDPRPEPVGLVRLDGRDYEFHGTLIHRIDADHYQAFEDPMLDFMWERGPLSDASKLVGRADEWLKKNAER